MSFITNLIQFQNISSIRKPLAISIKIDPFINNVSNASGYNAVIPREDPMFWLFLFTIGTAFTCGISIVIINTICKKCKIPCEIERDVELGRDIRI